ncbi:MAG: hypothetical protein NC932_03845 [Candidatus Omnitrophica bacterium]|nr:hypothetical protein [Candidatus Omnitrophota bacterium]
MSILNEEEKKRIEEEEEVRTKVRMKFEQKSSGIAGVLSSVCPGLGQIYNGQVGKASLYISMVLIGIILLSAGIYFQVKGMPTKGKPVTVIEKSEPVEMTEEGVIVEEATEKAEEEATSSEQQKEKKPATPLILIIIGAIGFLWGWNCSVKDAIRSAKKINTSY